jgi:hypothetical protein
MRTLSLERDARETRVGRQRNTEAATGAYRRGTGACPFRCRFPAVILEWDRYSHTGGVYAGL